MLIPVHFQPLLRQPYRHETWQSILIDFLPSGTLKLLQSPQTIIARCDDVTSTDQIGTIELPDGSTIALLEVHVADQIKLARNRVALRNFVARFIDEASTTAVLAVFHQPGKPDWRLTYACKRSQLDDDTLEITTTQTAPRRYTFLLGPNEPCRTAAGRLAEMREKGEHLTLQEVEKAFSVERLNKDFFKDYKKHYETFTAHLLAPENAKSTRTAFGITKHSEQADQDKADKPVRDFVKRLLGRLVFLHFLQKKGWMGCKAGGKSWTGGDADFLNSYFSHALSQKDAHRFHSRWLIPLFFDALNNAERTGDLFAPTGTRIPYLNGGLFENDAEPLHALDFPAEHFRALLDFFGQYHFTIDENDPEDHEVGIDPEMLGHIFENLLEDNKDKGAYYTPKAIVQYMARQSLQHYLQTHLGEHAELPLLLNEKDPANHPKGGFVHQHAHRIATLLDDVKICDPAIGSGAFPIGLLQEILWTRLTLNWELNTPEERAKLKRRIIQNSIHGVDLDPGAVEIARLRFWLALVVDEDQPRPLPNLDYKIHRADSLIEYIRGEPVRLDKEPPNNARFIAARDHLVTAKHKLFAAQRVPEKREARFELYRSLADLGEEVFTWMKLETDFTNGERLAALTASAREFHHRLTLIDNCAKQTAKTQDQILAQLRAWFDDEQNPTFLWQLHFGEVFAQGGFDIVIANPPYVRHETISHYAPLLRERYEVAASRADLLIFFYEQSVNLLKPGGVLTFITSNKYFRAGYGSKLRPFLASKLTLHSLIDFGDAPVFDAIAYASILIGSKRAPAKGHDISVCNWQPETALNRLLTVLEDTSFFVAQKSLDPNGWSLEKRDSIALMTKLRARGTPLMDYVNGRFFYGIKTGFNEAFVIDEETRNRLIAEDKKSADLIKPFLRGRDVKRWRVEPQNLYLIVFPFGFHSQLKNYPAILDHLTQFETMLKARGQCTSSRAGNDEGQHHWLELDNNPSIEYLSLFPEPKIILGRFVNRGAYCYDGRGFYHNDALYLIAGATPDLAVILNSSVIWWFLLMTSTVLQNGYIQTLIQNQRPIPIPPASPADKVRLSQLADACAAAAQRGDDATLSVHEAEIDQIVYRLFDLTPDEIALIESSLAPTRTTTPTRKRARAVPSLPVPAAMADDEEEATTADSPAPPTQRAAIPPPSPSPSPWGPHELFAHADELPIQPQQSKRAIHTTPTPLVSVPRETPDKNDILAHLREVLTEHGPCDRDTAIQQTAYALGYQRAGRVIAQDIDNAIRTAVRRCILLNDNSELRVNRASIREMEEDDRDFMKEQFLAAISEGGRVWIEREETARLYARWFGFQRKSSQIEDTTKSLINGLLRDKRLEAEGTFIRRV